MAQGMTSKRSIIIFWALFLVPTLIIALAAFQLLSHEQERISRSAVQALRERAKTISETIHLTVETVQENLTQSLLDIDPAQLKKNLIEWEETNPLVRNVFVYKKGRNLEYPIRGMESTLEERRFISRYDSLFSGRIKFDFNEGPSMAESGIKGMADTYPDSNRYDALPQKQIKSSRQKLVDLSRVVQKEPALEQQAVLSSEPAQYFIKKSGWIPWFSENHLYLLGWVQRLENGPVYGMELELMTLLSRFTTIISSLSVVFIKPEFIP